MLSRNILGIVSLLVLLSPVFVHTLAMGQNQQTYCPPTADPNNCHKVIIIGAGMAGLGAAKELQSHGYDFVILESNSLAGGRVFTGHGCSDIPKDPMCDNLTKINYDTHASMISGFVGNPITDLATLYNQSENLRGHILLKTTNYTKSVTYDENGLVSPERQKRMADNYGAFKKWMNNTRQNMTVDEPLQNAIDQFVQSQSFNESDTKDFASEIAWNVGNEYADDPVNLSWKYWDKIGYRAGGDSGTDQVFPNGFGDIITGLVNDVNPNNIRYNTTVNHVNYADQGVTVETTNSTYYGQYVISTIPIIALQNSNFIEKMPSNKTNAVNNATMGTLGQTYIYSKKGAFWDDVDWLYYVPSLNKTGQFVQFQNINRINGVPMLLAFNYGNYAEKLLQSNQNKIKKDLLEVLGHMYPEKVSTDYTHPDPNKVSLDDIIIVYRGESPSYSSVPVNFIVPGDFNLLSSPLVDDNGKNRVFFAGEATTWHYPQTTHGAYLTGLREANRVMTTDTGKYPPTHIQYDYWRYPNSTMTKSWKAFPEYIICHPGLMLVLKNNPTHDPLCKKPNVVPYLYEKHYIVDPSKADPSP